MIKQIYFTLLLLFFNHSIWAQTFVQLGTDVKGDATQVQSPDLKAISYATDPQVDSLWMILEFYSSLKKMECNIKIGLDSNNNTSDGGVWPGSNQSLSLDLLIDIFHNPNFNYLGGNIYDGSDSFISSNVALRFLDSHLLLVNLKLSEIKQSTKDLNLVAGCGIILGDIKDEIPNSGFFTIRGNNSSLAEWSAKQAVRIYPQPAKDFVFLEADAQLGRVKRVTVLNHWGQVVEEQEIRNSEGRVDVSKLAGGKYILILTYEYFGSRVVSMIK